MSYEQTHSRFPKLIEIPKLFYSDLTGAPIDKCICCECSLLEPTTQYMIEKSLKPYNGYQSYSTIFEYAICMSCMDSMKNIISTKSRENITAYFSQNLDPSYRSSILQSNNSNSIDPWVDRCMIKGTSIGELNECQVYAQCQGNQIVMEDFPYMVSGMALDEVVELLSAETLDDLERFKDEFVDGPSEFQDLLKSGPKVFI